ncbi:hypothetical protein DL1_15405 [Thioclava dalianensis]|uniref:Uncharacterized protein n=1 Tax=Thioclava dalianensis TaxID=1185766 RepID=A0A074TFH8_9RHOB|nr:hypothetical protein [Thioclava dalianensis]KEP70501.1 hypothetical protein DL1_15405 [Thioclava dalianensis]SFN08723.1 hypothetical protein SAMN05216224_102350 [Thioclava dalianensis]
MADTEPPRGAAPPPEFDAFLMQIGRINYAWTNTESLLIHLIAGLAGTDKETAVILHLTLNTTRARLDLVERLSKREACPVPDQARARVIKVTGRMKKVSGLRNHFNHCLYAFDAHGGPVRTIQMRIADRKTSLRIGEESVLDSATLAEMDAALLEMHAINAEIWAIVAEYDLPA